MSGNRTTSPRDPLKSTAYFHAYVARRREEMLAYTKLNNPKLYSGVASICLRIGVAFYSAGEDVSKCRHWFSQAATYQRRFLSEGRQFKLRGIGTIDNYLELYSAAFLVAQSNELIVALNKCTYTDPLPSGEKTLLDQFCDFLQGCSVETNEAEIAELSALNKRWAQLPILFSVVSKKDTIGTVAALDNYLANHWGPLAEESAKETLNSTTPDYGGKWSIFSAAVCKILGTVPNLSTKAKLYLPVDLVEP